MECRLCDGRILDAHTDHARQHGTRTNRYDITDVWLNQQNRMARRRKAAIVSDSAIESRLYVQDTRVPIEKIGKRRCQRIVQIAAHIGSEEARFGIHRTKP